MGRNGIEYADLIATCPNDTMSVSLGIEDTRTADQEDLGPANGTDGVGQRRGSLSSANMQMTCVEVEMKSRVSNGGVELSFLSLVLGWAS